MSKIPFSPNAAALLSQASHEASARGCQVMGTEHLVLAFCKHVDSRAMQWISRSSIPDVDSDVAKVTVSEQIVRFIEDRIRLAAGTKSELTRGTFLDDVETPLPLSPALYESILIARQIGAEPVRDGDIIHHDGLIASEFLLAGMLVEGTGLGAFALTRFSRGKVNSLTLLEAINVEPSTLLRQQSTDVNWTQFTLSAKETRLSMPELRPESAWSPLALPTLLDLELHEPPSNICNWLIPGKLIIGEQPAAADVKALLKVGVNVFVSLIGEYTSEAYRQQRYPRDVSAQGLCCDVTFYHFPVRDFDVVRESHLATFVEELKRVMTSHPSSCVYMHCRGGHGRTGMVVITLLTALYDVEYQEAKQLVVASTRRFRVNDRPYAKYIHLPETDEQEEVARKAELSVRKLRRR